MLLMHFVLFVLLLQVVRQLVLPGFLLPLRDCIAGAELLLHLLVQLLLLQLVLLLLVLLLLLPAWRQQPGPLPAAEELLLRLVAAAVCEPHLQEVWLLLLLLLQPPLLQQLLPPQQPLP